MDRADQSVCRVTGDGKVTYVAAWSIRLARTSPLPMVLLRTSSSDKGRSSGGNSTLFVPYSRMRWTHPMRKKRGITANAAVLSSWNSLSVRMKRPQTRKRIMVVQNNVNHQQTRRVGLSCPGERSGGGDE